MPSRFASHRTQEGFTLIELLITLAIIAILASVGIPSLLATRKAGNESTAISTLKSLVTAEETFRTRNLGGSNSYGALADLVAANSLAFPKDNGDGSFEARSYRFSTVVATSTEFALKAEPVSDTAGNRSFAVTNDGYVREKSAATLTESTVAQLQTLPIVAR